jgi:hypothetical protein
LIISDINLIDKVLVHLRSLFLLRGLANGYKILHRDGKYLLDVSGRLLI